MAGQVADGLVDGRWADNVPATDPLCLLGRMPSMASVPPTPRHTPRLNPKLEQLKLVDPWPAWFNPLRTAQREDSSMPPVQESTTTQGTVSIRSLVGTWQDSGDAKYELIADDDYSLTVRTMKPGKDELVTRQLIRREEKDEDGDIVWGKKEIAFVLDTQEAIKSMAQGTETPTRIVWWPVKPKRKSKPFYWRRDPATPDGVYTDGMGEHAELKRLYKQFGVSGMLLEGLAEGLRQDSVGVDEAVEMISRMMGMWLHMKDTDAGDRLIRLKLKALYIGKTMPRDSQEYQDFADGVNQIAYDILDEDPCEYDLDLQLGGLDPDEFMTFFS